MAESAEHEGLWFEDSLDGISRRADRRRVWVVVASVACIAALAVPVAVALASSGPAAKPAKTASSHLTRGVAERQVISALSATTSSGSFNVSYEFDPPTPPTVTTTTTTSVPTCNVISVVSGSVGSGVPVGVTSSGPAPKVPCDLRGLHGRRRGLRPPRCLDHHRPRNDRHRPLRDGGRVERDRTRADHPARQWHRRLGVRWCRLRACPGILGDRAGCIALRLRRLGGGHVGHTARSAGDGRALESDGVPRSRPEHDRRGQSDGHRHRRRRGRHHLYDLDRSGPGCRHSGPQPGAGEGDRRLIRHSEATGLYGYDGAGLRRRLWIHSSDPLGGAFLRRLHDEQRVDLLRLRLCWNGADARSNRSHRAACGCVSPDTGVAPTTTTTSSTTTVPPSTTVPSTTPPTPSTSVTEPPSSTTSTTSAVPIDLDDHRPGSDDDIGLSLGSPPTRGTGTGSVAQGSDVRRGEAT